MLPLTSRLSCSHQYDTICKSPWSYMTRPPPVFLNQRCQRNPGEQRLLLGRCYSTAGTQGGAVLAQLPRTPQGRKSHKPRKSRLPQLRKGPGGQGVSPVAGGPSRAGGFGVVDDRTALRRDKESEKGGSQATDGQGNLAALSS